MADKPKGRQGLASMDPQTKRRVQSAGGKASHKNDARTNNPSKTYTN